MLQWLDIVSQLKVNGYYQLIQGNHQIDPGLLLFVISDICWLSKECTTKHMSHEYQDQLNRLRLKVDYQLEL